MCLLCVGGCAHLYEDIVTASVCRWLIVDSKRSDSHIRSSSVDALRVRVAEHSRVFIFARALLLR